MIRTTYSEIRDAVRPGDLIAFGGQSFFSYLVKSATISNVSHIGGVSDHIMTTTEKDIKCFNTITESTSLNGNAGVVSSRLSGCINAYNGEVWWLPLNREHVSLALDETAFCTYMLEHTQRETEYDLPGAIKAWFDVLDFMGIGVSKRDDSKVYCVELYVGALVESGFLPQTINPAEVTPQELCSWKMFEPEYYLLKGKNRRIRDFNSVEVLEF